MPRFFFRTYDSEGEPQVDGEGVDLPDLEAARSEAVRTVREMACLTGATVEDERYFAVDVVDDHGNTVIRARLDERVELVGLAPHLARRAPLLADAGPSDFALNETRH
jgi:hypothetical protein